MILIRNNRDDSFHQFTNSAGFAADKIGLMIVKALWFLIKEI